MFNKYLWPFMVWDWPPTVHSLEPYLGYSVQDLALGWKIACNVRIKDTVLEHCAWDFLPIAPYNEQRDQRLLKMGAALVF